MPNNLIMVRHRLMTELVKLWKNGKLTSEDIDRLPLKLSPKHSKHAGRCCVHKERAVWKYKSLPLLGLNMEDETDELTPLSEYAKKALDRASNGQPKDEIMCVVDEACSACVQINYEVTEICRGCTARHCRILSYRYCKAGENRGGYRSCKREQRHRHHNRNALGSAYRRRHSRGNGAQGYSRGCSKSS